VEQLRIDSHHLSLELEFIYIFVCVYLKGHRLPDWVHQTMMLRFKPEVNRRLDWSITDRRITGLIHLFL
jgi:hypothetical protein